MAFRLRSLSTGSKRTLLAYSGLEKPHHQPATIIYIRCKNSFKPKVAPIVELERRLKNRHNGMDTVLKIYENEKQNFLSSNCWTAAVESLFRSDPKRKTLFKVRTINDLTVDYVSSTDANRRRRMEEFLNDLAQTMETKGIAFFGRHPTAKIARILSTDANAANSPAVQKFVDLAGQNIRMLVDRGQPLEVADVMNALARLNLRETFESALKYLQADGLDRLRWLLTQETTPQMVWSCALMNNRAPKLFRVVASRPERAVGPHMSIPCIIETLNAFIKLGHVNTKLFDRVMEFHRFFVLKGTASELAQLADAISYADQTDCTAYFEGLCERADYFATHGNASDFAKTLKAASIVMEPNTIPALAYAIDTQAHRILKQCLSIPKEITLEEYLETEKPEQEQKDLEKRHEEPPLQRSQIQVNQAVIYKTIHSVMTHIQSKTMKEPQKVEEKKAKPSMKNLATIIYAYSLLQHACPELHAEVENYADVIVARATPEQQNRIVKSFDAMGCEIPKFKEAILRWEEKQNNPTPLQPTEETPLQEDQLLIEA